MTQTLLDYYANLNAKRTGHRLDVPPVTSVSLHKPRHALPHCDVVPTNGIGTLADYWCVTHDAPSAEDRCEYGPSKR